MSNWQNFLIAVLGTSALAAGYNFIDKASEKTQIKDLLPIATAECTNLQWKTQTRNPQIAETTVISSATVTIQEYIYLCNLLENRQVTVVSPQEKGMQTKKKSKE
jgi:hypothetical protein